MTKNSNGAAGPVSPHEAPLILAFGGGKGGIGKSFVSTATAGCLAELGKQVVLIDGDFGGANLHTLLNIAIPSRTIFDFFSRRAKTLAETSLPTLIPGLRIICGAAGSFGLGNLSYSDKQKFLRHLRKLEADVVVLDLGAGMSFNEIDLFNAADMSVAVANPEPTSIQECYNFIKVALFRRLRRSFVDSPAVLAQVDRNTDDDHRQDTRLIADLGREIYKISAAEGERFANVVNGFCPRLILNRVFSFEETRDGLALQIAAGDLMNIRVEYWGYLNFDPAVKRALREMKPLALFAKDSENYGRLKEMLEKFVLKRGIAGRKPEPPYFVYSEKGAAALVDEESQRGGPGTICSLRCPFWNDCSYQQGGMMCRMPEPEYLHRAARRLVEE